MMASSLRPSALARLRPNRLHLNSCPSVRSVQTTASQSNPLRTGLYATVFAVSTGLFAVYYFDSRSALHRYVLTPLLRYTVDPETGHKVAVQVLRSGLGPKDVVPDDERLRAEIWGRELSNPIGIAAGFDKDGDAIDDLFDLGFSWVEIGSVTPKPQPGNPRPRVFHLPTDSAMINRYGFPSKGHEYVLARLRARLSSALGLESQTDQPASLRPDALLAVNLGKNKESDPASADDFVRGVRVFAPYADVLVVNVSSPNTPGLRGLQGREHLSNLLKTVSEARDAPLFPSTSSTSASRKPKIVLKIAPDLSEGEIIDIAEVVKAAGIDGVIVSNTTVQRPPTLADPNKSETGGLSGPPLKPLTLRCLRTLRAHLPANTPIIGCGGVSSGADALEYARAGASYVQMYTHFGYDGAGAARRVKDELTSLLEKEGKTWRRLVSESMAATAEKRDMSKPREEAPRTVEQLIEEGEELKGLLDRLAERMKREADTIGEIDSDVTAVPPTAI
ncbi:hypothetical protein GLOTRDRAFT_75640 [Gloeophyllum trabeum ATCC 11539]|uniref:Dihydroorotate dehydrogenase (quinone), mitochondrial n=1 Tax=Gloeophyllum trabeum (strain ATCC 11539 / FP-39264 / Madison 617) TaxID=670483 RepID=S7RUB3_GLOTA|nr:uncharacterized protein GLOTRDRAFT_75640 [Gloeophyllum trabeum ATCC 11539]EPQ56779.1 hypothetical protein GLOTRDRAFT_75640 [Gloeophyllum trabeum ATCC 11539]